MYNFKTDKIMFNDDYDYLHILDENEVVAIKQEYNDGETTNSNTYIFNIDSGKKVYSLSGEKFVDKIHTNSGVVYHIDSGLYNSKFKKIFSSYYNVTSDGIYVMNKNKDGVSLYDANGKKLNSYKIVGDFQTLFDNNEYYLTVYNGYLYIRGLNNSFAQKVGVGRKIIVLIVRVKYLILVIVNILTIILGLICGDLNILLMEIVVLGFALIQILRKF